MKLKLTTTGGEDVHVEELGCANPTKVPLVGMTVEKL